MAGVKFFGITIDSPSAFLRKNLEGSIQEKMPSTIEDIVDKATTVLFNRNRTRFREQVAPDGTPWIPSFSALIRQTGGYTYSNGRRVTGGHTLFATGRLFHSITPTKLGPFKHKIATSVPYAKYHQYGEGQIKREFLGINAEDVEAMHRVAEMLLQKAVKGLFNG